MRPRLLAALPCLGLFLLSVQTATPMAAEIKLLCAIALQQIMENLGPKFEGATNHRLATTIAPLGQALKRLQDGEDYDVVILPQRGIDGLTKDGKVIANTATALCRIAHWRRGSQGRAQTRHLDLRSLQAIHARCKLDHSRQPCVRRG